MLVVTVLLSLALAPPLAEDVPFQEGLRLFDDYEYEKAVFRFQEAARVEDRPAAERATIHLWLGMSYAGLGDFAGAAAAFDDAVSLYPAVTPPEDAPPKVLELLEEARARRVVKQQQQPATSSSPEAASSPEPSPSPPPAAPSTTDVTATAAGDAGEDASFPWALVGGGTAAALGALAFVGGGALGALALAHNDAAIAAPYQVDAMRVRGDAEAAALGANGLYAVGATLLGVAVAVAAFSFLDGAP